MRRRGASLPPPRPVLAPFPRAVYSASPLPPLPCATPFSTPTSHPGTDRSTSDFPSEPSTPLDPVYAPDPASFAPALYQIHAHVCHPRRACAPPRSIIVPPALPYYGIARVRPPPVFGHLALAPSLRFYWLWHFVLRHIEGFSVCRAEKPERNPIENEAGEGDIPQNGHFEICMSCRGTSPMPNATIFLTEALNSVLRALIKFRNVDRARCQFTW
jgi:hypothetical protein